MVSQYDEAMSSEHYCSKLGSENEVIAFGLTGSGKATKSNRSKLLTLLRIDFGELVLRVEKDDAASLEESISRPSPNATED